MARTRGAFGFWTPERQRFLRANYGRMTGPELAKALGARSKSAVYKKACLLGLTGKRPAPSRPRPGQPLEYRPAFVPLPALKLGWWHDL